MTEQLRHWYSGFRVRDQLAPAAFFAVSLDKPLYSNCSMVQRSRKAISPICSTFHTLSDVKEHHGLFEKSRGIPPVPLTVHVCQTTSLPLGQEWVRVIVARISTSLLYIVVNTTSSSAKI